MKYKTFAAITGILILLLAISCKKEDDPTSSYLSGTISLTYPEYVSAGFTKSFSIDTLTTLNRAGEYDKIGYYLVDYNNKMDTLIFADGTVKSHTFSITAPDTLATLSAMLSGYAEGYYTSSASVRYTVANDKSITGIEHSPEDTLFTDKRDGKRYYTAVQDSSVWLASNLKWKGAGHPFADCPVMTDLFGQYYTWEEANSACPEGWHLPSDREWVSLAVKYGADASSKVLEDIKGAAGDLMADAYFNGDKMWEYWPDVKITNKSGLAVLPLGYASIAEGAYSFTGKNKYAIFWTSDECDGFGVYRSFYVDKNMIFTGKASKTDFAASVRCVK